MQQYNMCTNTEGSPSGIVRSNWNDTEKISVAPAQGRRAQIEKCKQYVCQYRWRSPGGGGGPGGPPSRYHYHYYYY